MYFGDNAAPADVNGDGAVDFVKLEVFEGPDGVLEIGDDFGVFVTLLNTTPARAPRCVRLHLMLDRAARLLLLAGACLGGTVACDDAGPTRPTPVEAMIALESILGRTVTATINETHARCTAPPGSVIHYHFEDADPARAVRTDGLFRGCGDRLVVHAHGRTVRGG